MKFSSFFDAFPELVDTEFRNIFVMENSGHEHIPPGNYAFLEFFCEDINCDCRKVIINIVSVDPVKLWARFDYVWESEEFYKKWYGGDDIFYMPMSGVTYDFPENDLVQMEFVSTFKKIIKFDTHYAKRIEKHYSMFKEHISNKQKMKREAKILDFDQAKQKIGRNDMCSCNSGKKFKKCCLK